MIIPMRCFSCGKPISHLYEPFKQMVKDNVPIHEIWDKLGITRFCCKRMLVSHVDIVDDLLHFTRLQ